MNSKLFKYVSMGLIAVGTAGMYLAGATESTTAAIVAGIFAIAAIIANLVKNS